jgi:predicted DNA-binding ribbon-helix-helix protein
MGKLLDIPQTAPSVVRSLRIKASTWHTLQELATAYDCSVPRVLDAVADTYGPALMRDAKKLKEVKK